MSAVPGPPNPAPGPPAGQPVPYTPAPKAKPPIGTYIKVSIFTLVAAYVVAFVLLNKESVTINFVFLDAVVPLIFVLAGCVAIVAILGIAFSIWWRRRGQRKPPPPKGK